MCGTLQQLSLGNQSAWVNGSFGANMKNKHLVLLFFFVLLLGLIFRWLPVHYQSFFHTKLIKADANLVNRIVVGNPGKPDLTLERLQGKWLAQQNGRSTTVPGKEISDMINQLTGISTFQVVKTLEADTLGLSPENAILVTLSQLNGTTESLAIGRESLENAQPITFIRLPNHSGMYKVPGHFRALFSRNLNSFRLKTVVEFKPETIHKIGIQPAGSLPVYVQAADSTGQWKTPNGEYSVSSELISNWLSQFQRLADCPFADFFDESRAAETLHTTIFLGLDSGKFLTLRFFFVNPPNVPEDLSRVQNAEYQSKPAYVIHSSQNPSNYFYLPDTNLAAYLCHGPLEGALQVGDPDLKNNN